MCFKFENNSTGHITIGFISNEKKNIVSFYAHTTYLSLMNDYTIVDFNSAYKHGKLSRDILNSVSPHTYRSQAHTIEKKCF